MSGSDPGGDGAVRGARLGDVEGGRVDIQVQVEGCKRKRNGIQGQLRRGSFFRPGSKEHLARGGRRTVGIEKGYYYDNTY